MNEWYLPVCQINLVPQHHHGVGLLHWNDFGKNITPPGIQGFEGLQVSDIESQDAAIGAFVECGHHGAESLLSSCVPDLRGRADALWACGEWLEIGPMGSHCVEVCFSE